MVHWLDVSFGCWSFDLPRAMLLDIYQRIEDPTITIITSSPYDTAIVFTNATIDHSEVESYDDSSSI